MAIQSFFFVQQISALVPARFSLFSPKKKLLGRQESRAGTVAVSKDTWRSIQWMKLFILRLLQHKLPLDIFIVISLRLIFLLAVWSLAVYIERSGWNHKEFCQKHGRPERRKIKFPNAVFHLHDGDASVFRHKLKRINFITYWFEASLEF